MLFFLYVTLAPPSLRAQTLEEQINAMRREIEQLRHEIDTLKEEVRQAPAKAPELQTVGQARYPAEQPAAASGQANKVSENEAEQTPTPAEIVPMLQSQVAEQAQTKVESISRLPVKFFGTVVSNTFFNTGEANWVDLPNVVGPAFGPGFPGGSFNFSLRQSRLGAIVQGVTVGSMKATGYLGLDFYGGTVSSAPIGVPRILYAYIRLEGDKSALEVGQDEMILAPRNPASISALAVPELFRSGNLYLRVPQVRLERSFDLGDRDELVATGGILAPVAAYGAYTTNYPVTRSRYPAAQARLAWQAKPSAAGEEPIWSVGISGHYGRDRLTAGLLESWASAVDFDMRSGRLGFGGKGYVGRNIGALGGSLGQSGKSLGGYVEGRWKATERLHFNAGYGTDQLFDRVAYPAPLIKNAGLFANTIYQFTPELETSFEYRWLGTTPEQGAVRPNNHFDLTFVYSF